jgi:hypothetical protein
LNSFYISNNNPDEYLQDITEIARGLAFLGTPRSDSAFAQCAEMLAKSIGIKQTNAEVLGVPKMDSEVLARIRPGFHTIIETREKSLERELTSASMKSYLCLCLGR